MIKSCDFLQISSSYSSTVTTEMPAEGSQVYAMDRQQTEFEFSTSIRNRKISLHSLQSRCDFLLLCAKLMPSAFTLVA